jgi:hypothetical protein
MVDQNKEKRIIREHIISEYGSYIENHPPNGAEIRDVSELPYPKEEILDAITLEIVRESDDHRVEIMKACALMLADFQENVGPKPLTMVGISAADTISMVEVVQKDKSLLDSTFYRIKESATDQNKEKYDSFKKIADEEFGYIKRKLIAAEELRKKMPQEKKNQILG